MWSARSSNCIRGMRALRRPYGSITHKDWLKRALTGATFIGGALVGTIKAPLLITPPASPTTSPNWGVADEVHAAPPLSESPESPESPEPPESPAHSNPQAPPPSKSRLIAPDVSTVTPDESFNASRAYQTLREIVTFGQRYYDAPRRPEAIKNLATRLRAVGAQVSTQDLIQRESRSQRDYKLTNIVGRLYPERPLRILLGSHWDTRLWAEEDGDPTRRQTPISGANDGTSGVAVLIELARLIPYLGLKHVGVDIVLFDGEEFGRPGSNDYCAGSRYFARHLKTYYPQKDPIAVIVIDMVGDRDLAFPPEQSSIQRARALTKLVWREGIRLKLPAFLRGLGYAGHPAPPSRYIIDDHTPFQALKIPSILLIDLDYPHWHTHQDTFDQVSSESLNQTGRVLRSSIQELDRRAR